MDIYSDLHHKIVGFRVKLMIYTIFWCGSKSVQVNNESSNRVICFTEKKYGHLNSILQGKTAYRFKSILCLFNCQARLPFISEKSFLFVLWFNFNLFDIALRSQFFQAFVTPISQGYVILIINDFINHLVNWSRIFLTQKLPWSLISLAISNNNVLILVIFKQGIILSLLVWMFNVD